MIVFLIIKYFIISFFSILQWIGIAISNQDIFGIVKRERIMIAIEGIEVTQSTQNVRNDFPLIFGKTTYVRIYFPSWICDLNRVSRSATQSFRSVSQRDELV